MTNNKVKKKGQIFTPQYIVEIMLDYIDYNGKDIICKHIVDNSCGNGAFLKVIVDRYCSVAIQNNIVLNDLKEQLETFIHGIDIDKNVLIECKHSLDNIANQYGLSSVKWDLYNESSLSFTKFNGNMDYVVGNPPYVNVHNLDSNYDEVKKYSFANNGMTDLYLVFFEIGFNMLSDNGKMCYITPNSWLDSLAANKLRKYIIANGNLVSLTDFGFYQIFDAATTYSVISVFDKERNKNGFDYYVFDNIKRNRIFVDYITFDDCYIDSKFYLSDHNHLLILKDIKTNKCGNYVSVKNGFATLADDVFISDNVPDSNITIKALKSSTGKWHKCLFPYDKNGKILPKNVVFANKNIEEYFNKNKDKLLKGRKEWDTFYEYGRSQAIKDVWKNKISINWWLRGKNDLKLILVSAGEGTYSGLYVIINDENDSITFDDIFSILLDDNFIEYVKLLKKYKRGGYYTFSSKDVQQYINYMIFQKINNVEK